MKNFILLSIFLILVLSLPLILFTKKRNRIPSFEKYEELFVDEKQQELQLGQIKVTSFGTTTLLFDDGETQLLFDAFVSRPSLGKSLFSKIETDKTLVNQMIKDHKMDHLKGIFVSHSHYDHVFDAAYFAKQTGANLHGSKSTLNVGLGGGVSEDKLILFSEEPIQYGAFTVEVIPSIHSKPGRFNDDLGEIIETPLKQPVKMNDYLEGGSYDFLITIGKKRIIIRPSFNYIVDQFRGIPADILFLGISGLGKAEQFEKEQFYNETIRKIGAETVIPIHWDNFFKPLNSNLDGPYWILDNLEVGLDFLVDKSQKDCFKLQMLQGYKSVIIDLN